MKCCCALDPDASEECRRPSLHGRRRKRRADGASASVKRTRTGDAHADTAAGGVARRAELERAHALAWCGSGLARGDSRQSTERGVGCSAECEEADILALIYRREIHCAPASGPTGKMGGAPHGIHLFSDKLSGLTRSCRCRSLACRALPAWARAQADSIVHSHRHSCSVRHLPIRFRIDEAAHLPRERHHALRKGVGVRLLCLCEGRLRSRLVPVRCTRAE